MGQAKRSITVSIAAHYVPQRVQYLASALDAINKWQHNDVTISIVTNDLTLAKHTALVDVLNDLKSTGRAVHFDQTHGLAHPWHLTWWHKQHLRQWADHAGDGDLYCYIEDDIAVPPAALEYFLKHLDVAKENGVIPGFLRCEIDERNRAVSTDFRTYQTIKDDQIIHLSGTPFVSLDYPYWAGFMLDKELAVEYLQSPWADIVSADVQPQSRGHTCRVQSAWALTYHNVPAGLPSRLVAPVDANFQPLNDCYVWHTPNNYSATQIHGFATIEANSIFLRPGLRAKIINLRQGSTRFWRRIMSKLGRILGS